MFPANRTVSSSTKSQANDNDNNNHQHQHDKQQTQKQQQQLASEAAAAVAAGAARLAGSEAPGSGQHGGTRSDRSHSGQGQHRQSPEEEHSLMSCRDGERKSCTNGEEKQSYDDAKKKRRTFLGKLTASKSTEYTNNNKKKQLAKLAKEETIDEIDENNSMRSRRINNNNNKCHRMVFRVLKRKRIFIPLILISYIVATYCLPYVDIQTSIPKQLPSIPFNFRDGPLRPSTASQFKVERLFQEQIRGAESVALDSEGNMYMAIEGGIILYAHLNSSSPIKRGYYYDPQSSPATIGGNQYANSRFVETLLTTMTPQQQQQQTPPPDNSSLPGLVKIAELNGIKHMAYDRANKRRARDGQRSGGSWRRECQLDEKIYGPNLWQTSGTAATGQTTGATPNEIDTTGGGEPDSSAATSDKQANIGNNGNKFSTRVVVSRCSKPLGLRLSPDESYLYVVDTLSGLYRISLRVPDKPHSTQRLVTKLIDFRHPKSQLLPVIQFDATAASQQQSDALSDGNTNRFRAHLNVTLAAVDDLAIDYGAGSRGADIIYLSLASQNWIAIGYLYDLLEGRPSGAILRYDSGSNQLGILDPARLAHVRTSSQDLDNITSRLYRPFDSSANGGQQAYYGIGAPNLDEDDVFDDRPLHFPNGLQLTDDKQALLIADTSNKRIIKHYIRGPRRGASDLWAWTPNNPDNIRRGSDRQSETYWTAGCGEDATGKFDLNEWLKSWPMLRKFLLKQLYLIGYIIEQFGKHVYKSVGVQDFGYNVKIGHLLLEKMCPGMMVLQYNSYGDIIKSIHSKEFPNDLVYYSQVNEIIDAKNQEHILYLSSPAYSYVTKITLPSDSFDLPTSANTFR